MRTVRLDYHGFIKKIDAPRDTRSGDRITVPIMRGLSTDPEEDGLIYEMVTFRADTRDASRYRCAGCLHCSAARLDARVFARMAELVRERRRRNFLRKPRRSR